MKKTALITGITGQDGSTLASFLLEKGYRVVGMQQWSATDNTHNLSDFIDNENFILRYGDMGDSGSMARLIKEFTPDEVYNLAAMSHVGASFDIPELAGDTNGLGTLRLLEAIRIAGLEKKCRFYQASTSELFGNAAPPQNENTAFQPCSPYATAKLYGYWITVNYRESYGMHASNGILFNHESAIRGEHFVTRKITMAVAAIHNGLQDRLYLGNLNSMRDWGHAADYVKGMWLVLQQDKPDDYVLATGVAHSVREFVEAAFACTGVFIEWKGAGDKEKGYDKNSGRVLVEVDPAFYRPNEVNYLLGDPGKAIRKLGWRHERDFGQLVREMVDADLKAFQDNKETDREYEPCRMAS
jgi:GDPmannose 4,6-dehydratase